MSKTITKEACQWRAMGQVLCEWGDLTYAEVIEALSNNEEPIGADGEAIIMVCEAHENDELEYLAELIEEEYHSLLRFVGLPTEDDL